MAALAVLRLGSASSRELALQSCSWYRGGDATVLALGAPADEAIALGAFQRAGEAPAGSRVVVRGSGGAAAILAPGTLWMQLALPHAGALVPCTADKLLNRHVRPLLRALTRGSGVVASYFGRDWISAAGRPIALVSFAHDATSGRCAIEAVIGVRRSFAPQGRASFLGKEPATLEEIAGRPVADARVLDLVAEAYTSLPDVVLENATAKANALGPEVSAPEGAWQAVREEAIGTIGAGRDPAGRMRIGGELVASRDAVLRLEDLVATLPVDAVGGAVDEAFTTRGAVIFGVRSLASIRDAIVAAW